MEIQRGDIGTKYQVPIVDDLIDPVTFDPSSATLKKLIFSMPGNASAVVRNADAVELIAIDGENFWCLVYTVVPADALVFHIAPGRIKVQAEIVYADGRQWRSMKVATDNRGRPILVVNTL